MARLVGDCPFCGQKKVVINEEHAFAQWTLRLVIAQRGRDVRFRIRVQDGPEYSSRYPELIVYGPCKTTCNGGWMRSLEDRARRFMGDMITDGQLTFLDDAKASTLTLWTVKNRDGFRV
jgi:hypothetical protein